MEFLQVLAKCGDNDLLTILGVVKWFINVICWIIPIILIVLTVMDLFKAVTAGDEKKTKEAQKQVLTRAVYALIIFLVPTIVTLLFRLLPKAAFENNVDGYTWLDCWQEAKTN